MAVIVQRLIPADAAGIAFTADPVTGGDRVVVEGLQKARPGTPLIVTMVTPAELAAPAASGAAPQPGNG
jgi:pyruvate,water dikinase